MFHPLFKTFFRRQISKLVFKSEQQIAVHKPALGIGAVTLFL
jgi:hypothetical protein